MRVASSSWVNRRRTPSPGHSPPTRVAPCPNCCIPMRLPNPVTKIAFLTDATHLDALFRGTLNAVRHFCGTVVPVSTRIVVNLPSGAEVVFDPDAPQAGGRPGVTGELKYFRDYLWKLVIEAALEAIRADETDDWAPTEAPLVALLGLGYLIARTDEEAVRAHFVRLVVNAVLAHAAEAIRTSTLPGLPDRLRAAVPVGALRPQVLDALASRARRGWSDNLVDWDAEYVCAVGHALAEVPNPRAADWANAVAKLWASRINGREVDDRFFLSPAALALTTDFDTLYRATVAAMGGDPDVELAPEFEEFGGLFDRAGWYEPFKIRVLRARTRAMGRVIAEVQVSPAEFVRNTAREAVESGLFSEEYWRSELAVLVGQVVVAGHPEAVALEFADALMVLRGAETAVGFAVVCAGRLAETGRGDMGKALVEWLLAADIDVGRLSASLRAAVWIAIGNLRSESDPNSAMDAYAQAEEALTGLADADNWMRVLTQNRAQVLRDCGEYSRALALLADPDGGAEFAHEEAVVRTVVGDYQAALDSIDRALILDLRDDLLVRLLIVRATALHRLHRAGEALLALEAAWRLPAVRGVPAEAHTVAALVVIVGAPSSEFDAFVAECASFLSGVPVVELEPGVRQELVRTQVNRALVAGDSAGAYAALADAFPDLHHPDQMPAGLATLWARVVAAQGGDPWPLLRRVLVAVEAAIPSGSEAQFARGWLGRQRAVIDELLEVAADTGGPAAELLAVHELANSRDLVLEPVADLIPRVVGVDVVAVLDGARTLRLVVVPGDRTQEAMTAAIEIGADEVAAAVTAVSRYDRANPTEPQWSDRRTRPWWDFAARFAEVVRPLLSRETPLVVLPGRRLAPTPLHAAGWPGTPLVADRSVALAVNLHSYLSDTGSPFPDPPRPGRTVVIAVPKAEDSPRFTTDLIAAARQLTETDHDLLVGVDADASRVLSVCEGADEAFFLCHGHSGPGGPGLSVAAHGQLPRSVMPIETDPDLADFVVDWSRLATLVAAPTVVVTIGCATGRTRTGPAGIRVGLERGHLFSGGHTLISPLWNIDQNVALTWLRAFRAHHTPGSRTDLAEAHRAATLATLASHPHPYAWAAFTMTTRAPALTPPLGGRP
jgi:tetratricopeptide (TPR) repeat protein